MYLLILYFPLMNSIVCGLFGHFLERKGSMLITFGNMLCGLLFGMYALMEVLFTGTIVEVNLFT